MDTPAIELRGLTKEFHVGVSGRRLRALDGVSLTVRCGEIFGLLGANGSGKSTTLKILLGLLAPTAGECRVLGRAAGESAGRARVGYLPEAPAFYAHLSGRELVTYFARLSGLAGGKSLRARVECVLADVGLSAAANRAVGGYSKGMRQRLGLAQALVHDPDLLVLDEPTAGVDLEGSAQIEALILEQRARGKTVLLTSHTVAQVEALCDRVAVLERGRLVLDTSLNELSGRGGARLSWRSPSEAATREMEQWLAARGWPAMERSGPRGALEELLRGRKRRDD